MNRYVTAATRARLLANLVHGHAEGHARRRVLLDVVRHLHGAAAAFLDNSDTTGIPEEANTQLRAAHRACTSSGTGLSPALLGYVTAPITGHTPDLPEADPSHPALQRRARELRAHRLYVLEMGHLDSADEDVTLAALKALLNLHHEWAGLTSDAYNDRTFRPAA